MTRITPAGGLERVARPSTRAINIIYEAGAVEDWDGGASPAKIADALNQLADRRWPVTSIKTSDYTASNREIVRVDPS